MENTGERIAKNSLLALVARIVELLTGMLTVIIAARYLGVEDFGLYAFIRAIGLFMAPFIIFGSLRILMRDIAEDNTRAMSFVITGLVLNILAGIIAMVIAAGVAFGFHLTSQTALIALALSLLSQIFLAMIKTVSTVFIAFERIIYDCIVSILSRVLVITFFLGVILFDGGLVGFFISLVLANGLGLLTACTVLSLKFVRFQAKIDLQLVRYLVIESFPVAISGFLAQGYTYINVFLLKLFRSLVELSLFQAPQRMIAPMLLLPRSFLLAFVPTLVRMANREDAYSSLYTAYQKIMKYILILSLPVCIYGTVYASDIILVMFGQEFADASVALQILIWIVAPLFLNNLLDYILSSIKKQRLLMVSNGVCLVSNCGLGIILIRKYGYVGACWTSLFSYVVLLVVNFGFVSRYVGWLSLYQTGFWPFMAGAAMVGSLLIGGAFVHPVILIPGTCILYLGVLYAGNTFSPDEIQMFANIVRKRKRV